MQMNRMKLTTPARYFEAGTPAALFALLIFCLCVTPAMAAGGASQIVVSSNTTIGYFPAGGQDGSQVPISDSFVVGANGHVIVTDEWGNDLLEIDPTQPATSATTKLAKLSNGGPTGIDQYGNVYAAYDGYSGSIFKLPYNASTGQYTGFTTAPTAACIGGTSDTAPCVFAGNFATTVFTNGSGYADLVFDGSGNLFVATSTVPSTNGNSIYECNASCQTGSGAPLLIYADANPIGALAVDPWDNLFFSDGNNSTGKVTNLNEIPYKSGTYAAQPTVLESYTNKAGYGNGFSGVAVSGTGTVYFATNADGIFAIPNTQSGGLDLAGTYAVGMGGGYAIALDTKGSVYLVHYVGSPPSGDANYGVDRYRINSVGLGATTVGGTATSASASIIDNSGSCTPTISAAVTEFGVTSAEFTATPGTSCSAALGTGNGTISPALSLTGAVFSVTLGFNPTAAGERDAALTIADSANSGNGVAQLTGVGQGAIGNLDPGVSTAYSTGFTSPSAVVADPAGDVFVADSSAGKVYEIPSGSTTPTAIGSGFVAPTALAFDANGDLFIGDNGVPAVEEIVNTGTTGAFAAGTQSTIVSSEATPGGTALASVMGLAVGSSGTIYISDTANKRVISFNPLTGQAVVTLADESNGLSSPMGVAVDFSGNLYVADSSLNEVLVFWAVGGITTITPPDVTEATGVAVDASGSVLVADAATGNVVRIPDLSGTLTTAQAITVETISPQASSLSIDSWGNLYVASASGKSAYAIQRTAASINLGTVADGASNLGNVYLMNAGNESAMLANPDVTEPTNTMFTLEPASSNNPCMAGSTGPAGAWCVFTAEFAPPAGSNDSGPYSGTAEILVSTPAVSFPVNMSGTASVSAIEPQTITFSPPTAGYVGQQITLSATATSGLAVTFATSTPSVCTVSGTTAAFTAAGNCTVNANQAGGTNNSEVWAAAPQVTASITITAITPVGVPALLMNQANWLLALPNGGAFGGSGAGGTTFVVNPAGNPVVGTAYGSAVYLYNVKAGAWTKLGGVSNVGGLAQDSAGDLYISANYSGTIAKLPYNTSTGTYATLSDPTAKAPPQCTGSDTTECTVITNTAISGVTSMTLDSSGNLFIATDDQGGAAPSGTAHSIWECSAACQTGASAPVMLFQEPTGTSPYQLYIGAIAVDPWDNLFFTDSNFNSKGSNESTYSDLYELVYTAGTGYATTPTVLQTFTNKSPGGYDDELDSVVVTSSGTIYYGLQYDGVFAIPNSQSGGPVIADQYAIVAEGVKETALDPSGNVYWVAYNNSNGGDTLGQVLTTNNLTTPTAQLNGAQVSSSATVVDNAFGCGTAATIAIASSNPEFSATAGTTCSSVGVGGNGTLSAPISGSSYTATINFSATKAGPQTATLSLSDTTNGGTGTAMVTGTGQETPQTLAYTAPTTTTYTYAPGLTVTVSVTNGGSNNPATFTVDSSSTGAGTFSATTVTGTTSTAVLTITQAGSILIDANELGGLVSGVFYEPATQAQLTLTVSQAAQTIVFPQPTSPVTYSPTLTVTLNASGGGSGNPVTFTVDPSSTGAGTVSSSTVTNGTSTATLTVTQAGSIVIDANQAANADYAAATPVSQTIQVNQAAQTITFTPLTQPFYYIVTGATVTIQATGGGSDSAIVFTVDKSSTMTGSFSTSTVSGAVSTSTLTMPANQSPTSGTIVVDANQPGNTNYAAATQTQYTINVLAPLPTQTITFSTPQTQVAGTPLTLSATASSGFAVSYMSSTTSVCTVSGSTVTFANVTSASTCTITATQSGDNQYFAAAVPVTITFAVNPAGMTPSMTLSLSLSSLTIEPGTVGLAQITVNSVNNFAATQVTFACSGLPSGYTCTFNPSTITSFAPSSTTGLPGGSTATTALSIASPSTAALVRHDWRPLFPVTFAVALCFMGFRKRNRLQLLLLLVVVLAGLGMISGCGGNSSGSKQQPVTSTATITASGGGLQATSTVSVTVE